MKKYLSVFAKTFLFVSLGFALVAMAVVWGLNIQMPYLRLSIGAILVAGIFAGAILVFRKTTGIPLWNVIGGFLLVLPGILVIRQTLGILVFRFSFVLYAFAILCAAIYGVAVAVVYRKVRKESSTLNDLLKENHSEPQS